MVLLHQQLHQVRFLIGKGRDLRVWDPHIRLESIYGSNREYILNSIPHIGRLLAADLAELFAWGAEHLVVTQKPSPEVREALAKSGLPVLDLAGWL
ncbi:MAG: hypothetical protein EXQ47_07110 [Bryobacterales bacterium]|nr:hypothetical protein [Bryobacterales bacterium]